jgi:hypothetical protein
VSSSSKVATKPRVYIVGGCRSSQPPSASAYRSLVEHTVPDQQGWEADETQAVQSKPALPLTRIERGATIVFHGEAISAFDAWTMRLCNISVQERIASCVSRFSMGSHVVR